MDFFDRFLDWWKQPFNAQGSVIQWALFVGLVMIAAFAWSQIIKQIEPIT